MLRMESREWVVIESEAENERQWFDMVERCFGYQIMVRVAMEWASSLDTTLEGSWRVVALAEGWDVLEGETAAEYADRIANAEDARDEASTMRAAMYAGVN